MKGISLLWWKIWYWLVIVWFSFIWIFKINLGDLVWYQGEIYRVLNDSRGNMWRLAGLENNDDGWVLMKDCRKVLTLKNLLGSFETGYYFYRGWYRIWVNRKKGE